MPAFHGQLNGAQRYANQGDGARRIDGSERDPVASVTRALNELISLPFSGRRPRVESAAGGHWSFYGARKAAQHR
jgi:hypothetical protein